VLKFFLIEPIKDMGKLYPVTLSVSDIETSETGDFTFTPGRCTMQVGGTGSPLHAFGAQKSSNALRRNNRHLKKILERLSTAQRINRASDDAAGLGVSEQLRTNIRGFKMATRNVEDAMAALNIADGGATEISSMMQRQRELAITARNDTLTDHDRQSLDAEYQALSQEIDRLARGTRYNRQNTADGTDLASGSAAVQAGSEAGDQIALPAIDFTTATSGVAGTSIATSADAATALDSVDGAIQSLNQQRSTVGATINRFVSTVDNLSVAMINTQAAESVLRDQDMAEGIVELTRQQLLQEGGLSVFQRFNEISRNHIMGLLG
jgi:flagellin